MHKSIIRDIEQRDLKVRKNEGQDIYSINRLELTHVNWIDNPEDKNSNLFASIILSGPNTDSASNSDGDFEGVEPGHFAVAGNSQANCVCVARSKNKTSRATTQIEVVRL